MAISRMQEPRQLYGLGSFVKKITRPIKKVIKSPIGKAALLAGGAYLAGGALGGGGGLGNFRMLGSKFGSLFGGKALSPNAMGGKAPGLGNFLSRAFGGAKSALGGLGTKGILGIGAGAGLLGGLFARQAEETEEEYQARIEQLGPYLKQYYSNVGDTFGDQAVSPQEVEDFVTSQSIEYQGAKDGGIIGKKKKEKDKSIKEKILPKKKKDRLEELRKELNMQEGGIIMADVDEMEVGPRGKEEVMEESMMEDVRPSGLEKVASTLVDIATTLYKVATPMGMSYKMARAMYDRLPDISKQAVDDMGKEMQGGDDEEMSETLIMVEGKKDGGIMNLGGKEMDLRSGGFVPLGKKERADDVPARLSKNEFVFTADAVRAAGGGSVKKGAQKMYDTMKNLENRIR